VLLRQLQIIQHPIHRQFPEHDQLRNPHQRPALRWLNSWAMVLAEARVSQALARRSSFGVGGDGVYGAGAQSLIK